MQILSLLENHLASLSCTNASFFKKFQHSEVDELHRHYRDEDDSDYDPYADVESDEDSEDSTHLWFRCPCGCRGAVHQQEDTSYEYDPYGYFARPC